MSVDCVHPWQSNLDARSIVPIADEMGGVDMGEIKCVNNRLTMKKLDNNRFLVAAFFIY